MKNNYFVIINLSYFWIINVQRNTEAIKVLSAEFYFHKLITVHLELYLFYCFIHFLLYIGQY